MRQSERDRSFRKDAALLCSFSSGIAPSVHRNERLMVVRRPSYREIALGLRRAEQCLRTGASATDIPGHHRFRFRRCADDAKRLLVRAGNGNGHTRTPIPKRTGG